MHRRRADVHCPPVKSRMAGHLEGDPATGRGERASAAMLRLKPTARRERHGNAMQDGERGWR